MKKEMPIVLTACPWLRVRELSLLALMGISWFGLCISSHMTMPGWSILAQLVVIWCTWLIWWRLPDKHYSVGSIWLVAIGLRLMGLLAEPVFENDWIRYLWDGVLFVREGTPYDTIPLDRFADPEYQALFGSKLDEFGYPEVPTIYGPVAMGIFGISAWIAPANLFTLKLIMGCCELAGLYAAQRYLSRSAWMAYALCPLLIFEGWMNAHIDMLALSLVLIGLWVCYHIRCPTRSAVYAGIVSGLAVACRLQGLPLVVLLVWWKRSPLLGLIAGMTTLMCYGPFWLSGSAAGLDVSRDFLSFWLYNAMLLRSLTWSLPEQLARWSLLCSASLLLVYITWRGPLRVRLDQESTQVSNLPAADWLYAVLLLAGPVLNPWCCLWLLPFALGRDERWTIGFIVSASLGYLNYGNLDLSNGMDGLSPFDHHWLVLLAQWAILVMFFTSTWNKSPKCNTTI